MIGLCSLQLAGAANTPDGQLDGCTAESIEEEERIVRHALETAGGDSNGLTRALRQSLKKGHGAYDNNVIHRSAETKRLFEAARARAKGGRVTAIHLLEATLESSDKRLVKVLRKSGARPDKFRESLYYPVSSTSDRAEAQATKPSAENLSEGSILEEFGRDLTADAREGKIGEIIGRRDEILQIIQALARKKKNNPVLVGEAGVGKSAIVEALALRAAQGKDPQVLGGRRIIELNMASLLAGTTLRGQFEERMTKIIEEAAQDRNLILFIDEIHTIVGAGGGGAADASNLLKPAMARGQIKLIGATTIDEYRRYIEKDPALDRRFEKILIDEPTREDAVAMLKGLRPSLQTHHGTTYTDEAIEAAVDLSIRVDVDHRLPDKAIDLLDRAGARSTVTVLSMIQVVPGSGGETGTNAELEEGQVTAVDVANVLAEKMGMPLEIVAGHLEGGGAARLLGLADFLRESIKGQDHAIDRLSERMILAHAAVVERRGPLGVMLFLGPSGTGKTELARQLGIFLFGSDKNLIRFDMSEFKEEHSVSKLIGSPPGYVGHEDEGQLTGQIRSKPYSVVLLDEVEKAHPRILDVFLQVFDEGRITDAKGRLCDARNAIFVLTTNLGADLEMAGDDFESRNELNEVLKEWFRPELLNRIDEMIQFNHLGKDAISAILNGLIGKLISSIEAQHGVLIQVDEAAKAALIEAGYNPEYGARELHRTVERMVEMPFSRLVLSGDLKKNKNWIIAQLRGSIAIIPTEEASGD